MNISADLIIPAVLILGGGVGVMAVAIWLWEKVD